MTYNPDDFKPYLATCNDCGRTFDPDVVDARRGSDGELYCDECRPLVCDECGDLAEAGAAGWQKITDVSSGRVFIFDRCPKCAGRPDTPPVADPEDRGEDEAGLTQAIRATTPVVSPALGVKA